MAAHHLAEAIIIIGVLLLLLFLHMYANGAVNHHRLVHDPLRHFNGLAQVKVKFPKGLVDECLQKTSYIHDSPELIVGKRVVIPGWKAGTTIPTSLMPKRVLTWYQGELCRQASKIVGATLYPTPASLPTTCSLLTYDQPDDFINWHYDVNYFNGRFFTMIIMLRHSPTCDTSFVYKDADDETVYVNLEPGEAVLFEGSEVYHAATKLGGAGQYRHVLSMQYSTDPTISWYNRLLMAVKDRAYV
jgi:hypothetical protein